MIHIEYIFGGNPHLRPWPTQAGLPACVSERVNTWIIIQDGYCFVSLFLLNAQATSKVISGWAPTFDSLLSWRLHSAAPLGSHAVSTMTWYPTQSHYPDTEQISPCPILIMPSTWLGSDMYQFVKSLIWLVHGFEHTISPMRDQCATESATTPGQLAMENQF